MDVQSTLCTAKRDPCTRREPCARFALGSNRVEAALHVQASLLDVQRILCTIRPALVPPPQKMLAPCKRSACELFRDQLLDPMSFFCLRKGQQILVECSPRPEVNVDVHSQNLDVQRLSIRSGLRGDPKYSGFVETKTRKNVVLYRVIASMGKSFRMLRKSQNH